MLRLMGIAISIGLADSLNPTTIAPALYLASGERPRERVTQFTLAVFVVYLVGGIAIALGPGQLLLSVIPHPRRLAAHVIETSVGVLMIVAGMAIWRHRLRLSEREPPKFDPRGRSSWLLGATITAVELPTAFPYFAVIAAIVAADLDPVRELGLLVLFNVCFVLPLLGIAATLVFAPDRSGQLLGTGRRFLQRHWPKLLAGLAVAAGAFVVLLGVTGLVSATHGHLGRFARHFRHFIRP